MPVHGEIRKDYKPFHTYHEEKDMLTSTHSIIFADGIMDLFDIAFEVDPKDADTKRLESYKFKEVDAQTRFSITDGKIQVEVEVWDGDESDKLYYCGDLTLKQAIKLLQQKHFCMGFVPIGTPNFTLNAIKLFNREDLLDMLKIKQQGDALVKKPRFWKVG